VRRAAAPKISLPTALWEQLDRISRSSSAEYRLVERARIVLRAATGEASHSIARALGVDIKTVRLWRRRFARHPKMATLDDAPRSGRPARVPLYVRCELVKIACNRPNEEAFRDVWSRGSLVDALWQETGFRLSRSEVGRIVEEGELRPHRIRLWLHSPDPEFRPRVRRCCEAWKNRNRAALCRHASGLCELTSATTRKVRGRRVPRCGRCRQSTAMWPAVDPAPSSPRAT
jgi:transposase